MPNITGRANLRLFSPFKIHQLELDPSVVMSNHGPKLSFLQHSETCVSETSASRQKPIFMRGKLDSRPQIGP